MIGDKGIVSATKFKENDTYFLLFKLIITVIVLSIIFFVGYLKGLNKGEAIAESQIESMYEAFADGRPFTAFGTYKVWPALGNSDVCFMKAKERKGGRNK